MAIARPQLQQRLPLVDAQGRLSNEGLRALNDAFQSIFTTLDQIVELYGITDALNADLTALSGSGVVLAAPGGFAAGRVFSSTPTIAVLDGGAGGTITASFAGTTTNVPEGANLYFTNARARSALSSGTGIAYNSGTGQIAVSSKLAAYDGGDTPSAFTLSIVDSVDAAAWLAAIGATPSSRSISTGAGLVGGGNLTADRTLSLATSGVTAGSYGSATKVPTLTVDVYGRVTIASENTIPALASGTYTPTLTGVANVAGSTAYSCQYMRVGDVVTVSGKVDIQATAVTTNTRLGISLPIASALTNDYQCGGGGAPFGANSAVRIAADATNDRAELSYISADTNNRGFSFSFTYLVL